MRTYSSGMYMRLGFSVAMHIQPDVLLLDEVLAVGDEAFQQKCFGRIGDFKRAGGTIVFVSHDPSAVERICDRAIMLEHGRVARGGAGRRCRARVPPAARHGSRPRRPHGGTVARRARAACTRCEARGGRRHARATASPRASRWRSRSGSTRSTSVEGAASRSGSATRTGGRSARRPLEGVLLRPERLERLRLNFPGLPMREGRFFVDVGVTSRGSRRRARRSPSARSS